MRKENSNTGHEDSPSRSMKKRESTALQKLGEELAALPMGTLRTFSIPNDVANAIEDWQRMKDREARRRQMQYIGRLMREHDIQELASQYARWKEKGAAATAMQHRIEEVREQLLQGTLETKALETEFPGIEVHKLDSLVRQARQERTLSAAPKAYRSLFRYLRDTINK